MAGISTYPSRSVISPKTKTRPVVTAVSQATRAIKSSRRKPSRMASEIWSQSLSGWPSVTDSDVRKSDGAVMKVVLLILDSLSFARGPFRLARWSQETVPADLQVCRPGREPCGYAPLASRFPLPSRAFLPAREVRALLVGQLVDAHAERGELQPSDLRIDLVRDGVDVDGQALLLQDEVLDAERLVGEAHVHHARRMALRGREVDQPPLGEDEDAARSEE